MAEHVIGLDFGTDSARCVIVDAENGDELAGSVMDYPRWIQGKYCDPSMNQYRQHPLDYLETMEFIIKDSLSRCEEGLGENIRGIGIDTTGSTPVLTDETGLPLSMKPGFEENPDAMFILWKDHTAVKEAEEINSLARKWEEDYTRYEGGIYSSEWVWAKVLHVLRKDKTLRDASYSWVEHCDWIPSILTGITKPEDIKRSRCAAGHKAMWHEDWAGLPPEDFLAELDPLLAGYRNRLYRDTYTSDTKVGTLTPEWSEKLGLPGKVAVSVGAFDCHMGAVGGGITPNVLARAIGTSTCDIMIADYSDVGDKLIPGICGQVDGSVVPGYVGLEAGQSAFGDVYAWFKNVLAWPINELLGESELLEADTREKIRSEIMDKLIPELSKAAMEVPPGESGVYALDWLNGRRTPDANQELKGAIAGLSLGSTAPLIFRALVEATAFGSKAIVERFGREGVKISEIVGLGGVAKKSPFVMQTLADVLNMPIKIATTEQTCAVGAAMFAAVAGGVFSKVEEAQERMGKGIEKTYHPDPEKTRIYQKIYENYLSLGEFVESGQH